MARSKKANFKLPLSKALAFIGKNIKND